MMGFRESTVPSDYNTEVPWYCTIGKMEYEHEAKATIKLLQANGDPWPDEMPEWWLERLQSVRVKSPGPPELIREPKARGGLQLRYPNGNIIAAAFRFTDEEMDTLREYAR
jgi:hypothetical protein